MKHTYEFDQVDRNHERRPTHEHQSAGCHTGDLTEKTRDSGGVCYLITHVTSVGAAILMSPC